MDLPFSKEELIYLTGLFVLAHHDFSDARGGCQKKNERRDFLLNTMEMNDINFHNLKKELYHFVDGKGLIVNPKILNIIDCHLPEIQYLIEDSLSEKDMLQNARSKQKEREMKTLVYVQSYQENLRNFCQILEIDSLVVHQHGPDAWLLVGKAGDLNLKCESISGHITRLNINKNREVTYAELCHPDHEYAVESSSLTGKISRQELNLN